MVGRNPRWAAERIRGELLKLGIRVCKRTIQWYLREDRSPFGRERGEQRDHVFRSQDVVVGIGHLPWLHELSRVVAEPLVRLARPVEGSNDEPPGCG